MSPVVEGHRVESLPARTDQFLSILGRRRVLVVVVVVAVLADEAEGVGVDVDALLVVQARRAQLAT